MSRFCTNGAPNDKKFEQTLWALAESLLPDLPDDMPAYTQGLMDLGATVCKRNQPLCTTCPAGDICQAKAHTIALPNYRAKNRRNRPTSAPVLAGITPS